MCRCFGTILKTQGGIKREDSVDSIHKVNPRMRTSTQHVQCQNENLNAIKLDIEKSEEFIAKINELHAKTIDH